MLIPSLMCLLQYRQRGAALGFAVASVLGAIVILWFSSVYMQEVPASTDVFGPGF